jgi:nucleotide-binding universal stress UspA family protein
MFEHLIVPLDGSQLAEAALPAAVYLAQRLGVSIRLVHVVERAPPQMVHGERHLQSSEEAHAYLDAVASSMVPSTLDVERCVYGEDGAGIAQSIAEGTRGVKGALIVMAAHGRGGLRRRLLGAVAQRVVALGLTPVLLIQPTGEQPMQPFTCRRLLAPLDSDPEHQPGLDTAVALASLCGAALHLVMVVRTPQTLEGEKAAVASLLPATAAELLDAEQENAASELSRRMDQLRNAGLSVTGEVGRGRPTDEILRAAERVKADLIVLATHGKVGLDAFWSGSVTPQVSGRSLIPLLLVPAGESNQGM